MFDIDRFKYEKIAIRFANKDEYMIFEGICKKNQIINTCNYSLKKTYLYGFNGVRKIQTCSSDNFLTVKGWIIYNFSELIIPNFPLKQDLMDFLKE